VACVSKVGAVLLGARLAGMKIDRSLGDWLRPERPRRYRHHSGRVGLANRVIDERIFVAIVVMALISR